MSDTQQLPLSIQPVISYPREAQVGKTYLMTIDLQPSGDSEWLYEDEEYPIYCMLETSPLFSSKPVGEPAVVLHRFGGSYGAAQFLLTATQEEIEGLIRITLVNGWGMPVNVLCLDDIKIIPEITDKNPVSPIIAPQLGEIVELSYSTLTSKAQLDFLHQVLQATSYSDVDLQVIYPLLQENLHLLDDNLARVLREFGTTTLAQVEAEQARSIATDIANLSNLLQKFTLGSKANNLEITITGYEVALTIFTHDNNSEAWALLQALIQNNLGVAYSNRIRGERIENIELAIAAYQAALEVLTHEAFPRDRAMTQNNLGVAYSNRIRGERIENIELAIAAYQAALQIRTRDAFPRDWAMTQNNLGVAYSNRIQGEKEENIELAIAAYQAALEIHTRDAFPSQWAMTQNNLGNAYSDRIWGERAENIELAIAYYQAALEIHTRDAFPSQWAMTQNNLGFAYVNRIRGETAENIELAIAHYQATLEVYTREEFPSQWATTQNNLGNAYLYRLRGERAENIELAIASYQAALQVTSVLR
ncbi:MAG: tetratricopeptide repeat protein [Coleofasciculus chthonoplastes F3-SA18-01]|uniref:hypothetical protein n=1 Tax=Coleofasciculus chthonoplastes TaxID=64178 RepID=UPI003303772E